MQSMFRWCLVSTMPRDNIYFPGGMSTAASRQSRAAAVTSRKEKRWLTTCWGHNHGFPNDKTVDAIERSSNCRTLRKEGHLVNGEVRCHTIL